MTESQNQSETHKKAYFKAIQIRQWYLDTVGFPSSMEKEYKATSGSVFLSATPTGVLSFFT
jgi:hypothetical protein